ncbi:MAG TPA: PEP-CTERM sorting domain-containing protein [Candidatus Sulfotelmatobacter sp.]|nr:PEP-CTERM sorting domain-containing protein [Candidatus Sulfotelmatobacter sp.]
MNLLMTNEEDFRPKNEGRPVYPYSVVPGGVADIRELKWVAEHDPIVAAHYAGFDYDHARVVRLVLERTAYVSYRIGNHIYWTRRRISLHKGEKLITDGKKTMRARCGNRVEEVPQQATSSSEPPAEKFEQPAQGTAVQAPPVPFQSALLNRRGVPGPEPNLPLNLFDPMEGTRWVPFSLPPLPSAVCAPTGKKGKNGSNGSGNGENSGKKGKKVGACGPGGPTVVPEPGTLLLVGSGIVFIAWFTRRKLVRI